jgi:hypothetical protein
MSTDRTKDDKERIDAALEPLGLIGSRYSFGGRQYHGSYRGRGVHVFSNAVLIRPGRNASSIYMGHDFAIHLDSPLQTRAALTHTAGVKALNNRHIRGLTEIAAQEFDSANLVFVAIEPAWAARVVKKASNLLLLIATQDQPPMFNALQVHPGGVALTLRLSDVQLLTPGLAQRWLEDLSAFAAITEAVPPPARPIQERMFERWGRIHRTRMVAIKIAVALAIATLLFTLFILPFLLLW